MKPRVKSFLIADTVIQEGATNKWSAIGIFDGLTAKNFPTTHPSLGIYIRLTDAEGDYDIRIEFCDASGRKLAIFEGIKLRVPSRTLAPDIGIQTRNLPIPKPGKYDFHLFFNNELIESMHLDVNKLE